MDGIKEALEYVVNLSQPNYTEHEGEKWADKPMHRIHFKLPKAEPIKMNTLTSLIEYIQSNTDQMAEHMIIHVQSPTQVSLYSQLNNDRIREQLVRVNALLPEFEFNRYHPVENFLISVMSKFIGENANSIEMGSDQRTNDKELILKFAGTVESGTVTNYGDDGISQKATIQQTVTSKEDAIIPSPAYLVPYRTFLEVDQPGSDFIFRMRDSGNGRGPEAALFEADGGAWKIEAMKSIHNYLEESMKDINIPQNITFTVIS